jgi:membrane protease YdiL (CAAX protease family)
MNLFFNLVIMKLFHTTSTANQDNINALLSMNTAVLVVFSLSAVFIAPFVEEFIFRGLITKFFFTKGNWWYSIILSGVLFSLGHASDNFVSYLLYATMGGILAYVFKKSGQIKMSIAVHMLNNGVAMVMTVIMLLAHK